MKAKKIQQTKVKKKITEESRCPSNEEKEANFTSMIKQKKRKYLYVEAKTSKIRD